MADQKIEVSLKALKDVLTALAGESCCIRELQATMSLSKHLKNHKPNCINILIEDYNNFVDRNKPKNTESND